MYEQQRRLSPPRVAQNVRGRRCNHQCCPTFASVWYSTHRAKMIGTLAAPSTITRTDRASPAAAVRFSQGSRAACTTHRNIYRSNNIDITILPSLLLLHTEWVIFKVNEHQGSALQSANALLPENRPEHSVLVYLVEADRVHFSDTRRLWLPLRLLKMDNHRWVQDSVGDSP